MIPPWAPLCIELYDNSVEPSYYEQQGDVPWCPSAPDLGEDTGGAHSFLKAGLTR